MTDKGRKYLSDILRAIKLIEDFTRETDSYKTYESDPKTQSATERQLAIIGEALKNFSKDEPDITIENDKQIISFRNRLIHAYDSIDNAIVWMIIQKHLPKLKEEIENLGSNV